VLRSRLFLAGCRRSRETRFLGPHSDRFVVEHLTNDQETGFLKRAGDFSDSLLGMLERELLLLTKTLDDDDVRRLVAIARVLGNLADSDD